MNIIYEDDYFIAVNKEAGIEADNNLIDIIKKEQSHIDNLYLVHRIDKFTSGIVILARDEETNVVLGLDIGADDYIIKPFRIRELISRINSVLRRYDKNMANSRIVYQDIVIDTKKAKVYQNNQEIIFTSLEYKILLMLFTNQNKLITRDQLLDKIWDIAGNFVNDNTLTVYIKRIREKIGDKQGNIIQTVRGIGYRIGD